MVLRRCKKCNNVYTIDNYRTFIRNNNKYNGHTCRECRTLISSNKKKTKEGLPVVIYCSQILSSKRKKYPKPNYTLSELREWMFSQTNFETLYNNWVASGYVRHLKPSCDRLDDYKPYSLDNLRLVTWEENNKKGREDIKSGINNKKNKTVLQYDLNGNFIKEFYSLAEAFRKTKVYRSNIYKTCIGKYNQSGGYIWKYK